MRARKFIVFGNLAVVLILPFFQATCLAAPLSTDYMTVRTAMEANAVKIKALKYVYDYTRSIAHPPGFFAGSEIWGAGNVNLSLDDERITSTSETGHISVDARSNLLTVEVSRNNMIGQIQNGGIKPMKYRVPPDEIHVFLTPDLEIVKTLERVETQNPEIPTALKIGVEFTTPTKTMSDLLLDTAITQEVLFNAGIRSFNHGLETFPEQSGVLFADSHVTTDGAFVILRDARQAKHVFGGDSNLMLKQEWKVDSATSMPVAKVAYVEDPNTSSVQYLSIALVTWTNHKDLLLPARILTGASNSTTAVAVEDVSTIEDPNFLLNVHLRKDSVEFVRNKNGELPPKILKPALMPRG